MVDKEVVAETCNFLAQRIDQLKTLVEWKNENSTWWWPRERAMERVYQQIVDAVAEICLLCGGETEEDESKRAQMKRVQARRSPLKVSDAVVDHFCQIYFEHRDLLVHHPQCITADQVARSSARLVDDAREFLCQVRISLWPQLQDIDPEMWGKEFTQWDLRWVLPEGYPV